MPTFKEQLRERAGKRFGNTFANAASDLLDEHGEIMVQLQTGQEVNIHLGDTGEMTEAMIDFTDKEGGRHLVPWGQVVQVRMHKGYVTD